MSVMLKRPVYACGQRGPSDPICHLTLGRACENQAAGLPGPESKDALVLPRTTSTPNTTANTQAPNSCQLFLRRVWAGGPPFLKKAFVWPGVAKREEQKLDARAGRGVRCGRGGARVDSD